MKKMFRIAKRTVNNSEGFLNGFIKGALIAMTVVVVLSLFTGCLG